MRCREEQLKESEKLIRELRIWVDAKHGRRVEIADKLKKSPQLISDWLSGRAAPRLDTAFALKAFLERAAKGSQGKVKETRQGK
jgi:transcriptional regulator with XRE-family HTH domain